MKNLKNKILHFINYLIRKLDNQPFEDLIIKTINEHPSRQHQLSKIEAKILRNILKCYSVEVEDIMIPRSGIKAIETNSKAKEIKKFFHNSDHHTRIPVYKKDLDSIIGFVNSKEILSGLLNKPSKIKLSDYLHDVLIVSPAMKPLDLLNKMQATRTHMAIIVDEYGGVDGLVTLENALECLVGNIEDENDYDYDKGFVRLNAKEIEVNANLGIQKVEKLCNIKLVKQNNEYDTISGLILSLLGYVPKKGEIIKFTPNLEFKILDSNPRKINKVLILKK